MLSLSLSLISLYYTRQQNHLKNIFKNARENTAGNHPTRNEIKKRGVRCAALVSGTKRPIGGKVREEPCGRSLIERRFHWRRSQSEETPLRSHQPTFSYLLCPIHETRQANGPTKKQHKQEEEQSGWHLRLEVRMSSGVERSVAASERGVPAASRPSLRLSEAAALEEDEESAAAAAAAAIVGDKEAPLLLLDEGDSGWPWMTLCPLLKTSRPAAIDVSIEMLLNSGL